jgi:hypothetical protein
MLCWLTRAVHFHSLFKEVSHKKHKSSKATNNKYRTRTSAADMQQQLHNEAAFDDAQYGNTIINIRSCDVFKHNKARLANTFRHSDIPCGRYRKADDVQRQIDVCLAWFVFLQHSCSIKGGCSRSTLSCHRDEALRPRLSTTCHRGVGSCRDVGTGARVRPQLPRSPNMPLKSTSVVLRT